MPSQQRDPQTYAVIGACMAVHRELGHGFLEPVYQEALQIEFCHRKIPHQREKTLKIKYRDILLKSIYKADFVCFNSVIVELKALAGLDPAHEAQVINYLKATGLERGLLVNFGSPRLQYKRLILSHEYLRRAAASSDDQRASADEDQQST